MSKRTTFSLCFLLAVCQFSCSKGDQKPASSSPPSTDTVIHVTAVTNSITEFILMPAMAQQLTAVVTPSNAVHKELSWSTSDSTVAKVDLSGLVTGVHAGIATITATSKDNPSAKVDTKLTVLRDYDVYAVGNRLSPTWDHEAVLWKNGAGYRLYGGYDVGIDAYAIMLDGDDVYVAGNTITSSGWTIPAYWKNGTAHIVGDDQVSYATHARSITVLGGKVYMAGYSFYTSECPVYCFGRSRAFYWVDDAGKVTQTLLADSISSTTATGIAVSGEDVIVAGGQANNNGPKWSCWWMNDVGHVTMLTPADGFYEAEAVAVHGSDFYFAGSGGCANYGCLATAFVWKNDLSHAIPLTDGSQDARASCMAFAGDTLYVGGYKANAAGIKVASYWRIVGNQISSPRSLSDGITDAMVNGIAIAGNNIFLVGTTNPPGGGVGNSVSWRAYEGGSIPMFLEMTDQYVPGGQVAYGIAVK